MTWGTGTLYIPRESLIRNGINVCLFVNAHNDHLPVAQTNVGNVTIVILPDNVLIEIFDSYINDGAWLTGDWHDLVHVCRRWRYLVFTSPRGLCVRLKYTGAKPMTEMLDVWPHLSITIEQHDLYYDNINLSLQGLHMANVAALLSSEHFHRISQISLFIT